eukprot:scaffold46697_cov35-Prasinocladus_malaysianus.AAC.1
MLAIDTLGIKLTDTVCVQQPVLPGRLDAQTVSKGSSYECTRFLASSRTLPITNAGHHISLWGLGGGCSAIQELQVALGFFPGPVPILQHLPRAASYHSSSTTARSFGLRHHRVLICG